MRSPQAELVTNYRIDRSLEATTSLWLPHCHHDAGYPSVLSLIRWLALRCCRTVAIEAG